MLLEMVEELDEELAAEVEGVGFRCFASSTFGSYLQKRTDV